MTSAASMDLGDTSAVVRAASPSPIVTKHADIRVTDLSAERVLEELTTRGPLLPADRSHLIVTPNMHHLALLQDTDELSAAYESASMVLPDGWPVVRLANGLGYRVEQRLTGSDLVSWLAESDGAGRRVHIIGGSTPESLRAAEERFLAAGWTVGADQAARDWLSDSANLVALGAQLDEERPDIVLVGVGTPKQEHLAQLLRRGSNTAVFICVGAGIDFLSGEKHRAPRWMQRVGLEWLHRIASEPGRLFKRYVSDVPPFLAVVAASRRRARTIR